MKTFGILKRIDNGWALIYVDNGPNLNADWVVANKSTGQLRHYSTIQLKLAPNFTHGLNVQ